MLPIEENNTAFVLSFITYKQLLGGSPYPDLDSDENVISVFINKVINPDKPFESSVSTGQ